MNAQGVVVIGAGPAGLACAARVATTGVPVTLVEGNLPGGQLFEAADVGLRPGVEGSAPCSGDELATVLQEQVAEAGVEFRFGRATGLVPSSSGVEVALEDGSSLTGAVAVVATGTHRLPVGADVDEAMTTHCLPCDGPLLKGRVIAFVGTTAPFADDLAVALRYADSVVVVRPPHQPPLTAPVAGGSVQVLDGEVRSVSGSPGQLTIAVAAVDGSTTTVSAATIVPSLGHVPNDELLAGLESDRVLATGCVREDLRNGSPVDAVADGWAVGARVVQALAAAAG